MNDNDHLRLFTRGSTESHEGFLRNVKHLSNVYETIVNDVFAHQPAVYDEVLAPESSYTAIRLAAYFYKHCYSAPILKKGDMSGFQMTVTDFIDHVILANEYPRRNRLSYLLGEVGIGKTAFINSLITRHGPSLIKKHPMWFVRVDLEIAGQDRNVSLEDLTTLISDKVVRILEERPELLRNSSGQIPDHVTRSLAELRGSREHTVRAEILLQLVQAITRDSHRRLCLIIDNIDYICHIRDRALYETDGDTKEMELLEGVCRLARLFFHDSHDFGKLGANVLFVMRPDTYQVLAQAGKTSLPEPSVWEAMNAYVLAAPSWHTVLEGRGKLLDYAKQWLPAGSTRASFTGIIEAIELDLSTGPPTEHKAIDHLTQLTNHSLREMMKFFNQYVWIGSGEAGYEQMYSRIAKQYPVTLITYMLGRRKRFSQFTSCFPNIYLVNSPTRPHKHTYWLKRLLVELLLTKAKTEENFPPERIIALFRGNGRTGYEDEIIRECLGSLSEVNCSNLLRVTRRMNMSNVLQIDKLHLTPRGMHCATSIFDRFFYLQLVVDDYMLPLPRTFQEDFILSHDTPDYKYVVYTQPTDFHEGTIKMVRYKVRLILLFLHILRCALDCEKEFYHSAFDNLQRHDVVIPDVDIIASRILTELQYLVSSLSPGARALVDLERLKEETDKLRTIIYEQINEVYFNS